MKQLWYGLIALVSTPAAIAAEMPLNMTQGVTSISSEVYNLHMIILYICCAIGILVFSVMIYSMINHRKSKGAVAANFHESTKVEIIWTVLPFIILILMAIPATKTLIAMEDTSDADITVKITGSQWKWHYSYFNQDIEFFSSLSTPRAQIEGSEQKGENYLLEVDKPLVLPINKKIRFLMTSDDVIHSWWVPAFAVKKDANPGFINEAWTRIDKPGIYRGQCAELCGKDHGFMPIVVKVLTEKDFEQWLIDQKQAAEVAAKEAKAALSKTLTMEELMQQGEQVYLASCAACHQPNGMGLPGVFPAMKDSPIIKGDVKAHIDIVVNGKAGTAMQAFAKQLTAQEIAAVVTYERNAWGNNSGDMVQAADVTSPANTEAAPTSPTTPKAATPTKPKAAINAAAPNEPKISDKAADSTPSTMSEMMQQGKQVYLSHCAACHQPNGMGLPGAFPAMKGSPIVTGDIGEHIEIIVNGKPGTAMQAFAKQLTAKEIAAVVTYERNAWGNNTGDLVQASDVNQHGQ